MIHALSLFLTLFAAPAGAQIVGPDAARCGPGGGPAMLVVVSGLKHRGGKVRVRSFGGNPSTWFSKKTFLQRVNIITPRSGPIQICMPVPGPGSYAVDVRHDANSNNDTDRADGGGASGNPHITLFDVVLGRKPAVAKTRVAVGQGVTTVPVTVMYLKAGAFRPAAD